MTEALLEAFRSVPAPLVVFVLAMLPVTELRGAIPVGVVVLKLPAAQAFLFAVLGNLVVVPVVVLTLGPVTSWGRRHFRFADRILDWLFARTHRKLGPSFERVRDLTLVTFVAIPLPGTGSWSGALAGLVFGVSPRRQILLIGAGVVIAGILVAVLVAAGVRLVGVDAH